MADFGLSTIFGLIGSGISAAGTLAAGAAQKSAAEYQAEQLEQQAAEERAAAQREAADVDKERNFLLSRQQALASTSNLGALDETVLDLAGDIEQESAFKKGMVKYGGESRAQGRMSQAAAARMEGKAAMTGSIFGAAGTLASGIGRFSDAYSTRRPLNSSTSYSGRYAYG